MCIEDSYTLRTEMNEFKKFAVGHLGMNSLALDDYMQVQSSYISPTIIEERPMNVAQMDVFSRLMMDRIIFLGTQINDYTANVIQAQLLFLDSSEPARISRSISTLRVARSMRATGSTTRCSSSRAMYLLYVRGWQHPWLPSSSSQGPRASALLCPTPV